MSVFRMAFATDQHINLENINSLGIDVCGNFIRLLDYISSKHYDLLVLGGDLCFDIGEKKVYQWFQEKLLSLDFPVIIIPGNHDSPELIQQTFGLFPIQDNGEYYGKKIFDFGPMFFLDTSPGSLSDKQFSWLQQEFQSVKSNQVFISMHHPPVWSGSIHMDTKYAFTQIDRFYGLTQAFSHLEFYIFAGHYHLERTIVHKNVTVFITPSSYVNIDPEQEKFIPLQTQKIGYRECVWSPDHFYTNVYYLP